MDFKVTKKITLTEEIFDARYHPTDDNLIGVATIAGNIYTIKDGKLNAILKKHHKGSPIRRLRFDSSGNMVTIAKTVKIFDLNASQNLHALRRDDQARTTFYTVMSLGNDLIIAGDDNGKLFVWDTRDPDKVVFSSHDCEQYISDIDGRYEGRKVVCTSGEGTLTAYDLRAFKMIEPQSELFEAGFECVKMIDANRKVVIGGEDGAVYVFNQNEWAHTSGKFAIGDDSQNRSKSGIQGIDILPDNSTFVSACSDGRLRSFTLWPHQVLSEHILCNRNSLDTIHVSPHPSRPEIVVGGDKYINLIQFEEKSDEEDEIKSESEITSSADDSSDESAEADGGSKQQGQKRADYDNQKDNSKKLKANTDDYLNIF